MIQAVLIFNTHGTYITSTTEHSKAMSCRPVCCIVPTYTSSGSGKPRLSKFYNTIPPLIQQSLIAQIFSLISDRPSGLCNFLDAPDLVFPSPGTFGKGKEKKRKAGGDDDSRVIYRHYATLYFV